MPQPLTAPVPAPTSGATSSSQAGAAPVREDGVFPKALGQAQRAQDPAPRAERPAPAKDDRPAERPAKDAEEAPRAEGPAAPRPARPASDTPAKAESGKEPPGDPGDPKEAAEAAASQAAAQVASTTVAAAAVALMQSLVAPTEPAAATLVEPIRGLPSVLPTEGKVQLGVTAEPTANAQVPVMPQALPGTPAPEQTAGHGDPGAAVAAQPPLATASEGKAPIQAPVPEAGAAIAEATPNPAGASATVAEGAPSPVQTQAQAISTLVVEAPAAPHAAVATAAVRAQLQPEEPAPARPNSRTEDTPATLREDRAAVVQEPQSVETHPQVKAPAAAPAKAAPPAATLPEVVEAAPAAPAAPVPVQTPKAAEPEKEAKSAPAAEAPVAAARTHGTEKPLEPSQPAPTLTRPVDVTVQVHAGPGTPVQGPVTTLPVPTAPETRPLPHVAWQEAQQVGAQVDGSIKWLLRQQGGAAELQLHPENLGKVVIQLKVEGQEVHAKVWASEPGTLPLIQEHRASLEIGLQQQGLSLGSFDLQHGAQHGRFDQETQASRAAFLKQIEPEGRAVQQEMPVLGRFLSRNAGQVEVYA